MKLKIQLVLSVLLLISNSAVYAVNAVLNQNTNSQTALSSIQTCSGSDAPLLKIKLWNNGNSYSFPDGNFVVIQWFQRIGSTVKMQDQFILGIVSGIMAVLLTLN